jgi:hypothetical protein
MKRNSQEIVNCNILNVEVGTNVPQGGDAGHGGKTFFELKDEGGTSWTITKLGDDEGVRIELGGDSECITFANALRWAADELDRMVAENKKR